MIDLVERELEFVGAQEVLLPTLVPQTLWRQSKRLERQQDALNHVYNLEDRGGNKFLLGPTFEESITQLISNLETPASHELPIMFYQTSPKFRYEPNPRFGLIRSNEFLMNDLYSFDSSFEKATETYETITKVYDKIFKKLDLKCLRFESGMGSIGGKYSHEYQLPVCSGEDTLLSCNNCQYAFNSEMLVETTGDIKEDQCTRCKSFDVDKIQALELGHTFLLSDTYSKPLNVRVPTDDGPKVFYEMGCYGLGLTRIIGAGLDLFSILPANKSAADQETPVQMRWPTNIEPYKVGIVAPATRSKQYHGGSNEFIERIARTLLDTTSNLDIIIEDRGKEGISKRIGKLQSLGIPNIVVVGQRFLQDPPEVELLRLDENKRDYKQIWLTEEQLYDFVQRM